MLHQTPRFRAAIEHIRRVDDRYPLDSYIFLLKSLDYVVEKEKNSIKEEENISTIDDIPYPTTESSQQVDADVLVKGFCEYAQQEWESMAPFVLKQWNIQFPLDIGSMVYNLIGVGILGKSESDKFEDFDIPFTLTDILPNKPKMLAPTT